MSFTAKQSDYFYNQKSDEFFVCTISTISAEGPACKGDLIAHYPFFYGIERDTNRSRLLYPSTSATQLTAEDVQGYVYSLVPECSSDIVVTEISKPLISYNSSSDLYNVAFAGKYEDSSDGLAVFSYVFQYVDEEMNLVDSYAFIPIEKNYKDRFTFDGGFLNSRYFINGSSTETKKSFFGEVSFERPPNNRVRPFHYGNDLKMTAGLYSNSSSDLSAASALPLGYACSYIAQRKDDRAYDPSKCIKVDFTCKSYSVPSQLGIFTTQTGVTSSSRYMDEFAVGGPGEAITVFFYDPGDDNEDVELNGVESSMGYVPASGMIFEVGGFNQFETPGINKNGFVAVSFDIAGNFCTASDGKFGPYSETLSFTQSPCSIGIRGGFDNDYKVLSQSSQITAVSLHEDVADASSATYKDFRVELSKASREIIISGKENSDPNYTELHRLDMSSLSGYSFTVPEKLKAGLSFSTSLSASNFELKSFKTEGVLKE